MKNFLIMMLFAISIASICLAIHGTSAKKFKTMGIMHWGNVISTWIIGIIVLLAALCVLFGIIPFPFGRKINSIFKFHTSKASNHTKSKMKYSH